ncbi:hypothetical protein M758_UG087000 [Ceratodon purpureus]|nr:hypothetical protein M758_UG087000 [Ceratodon purpureus]
MYPRTAWIRLRGRGSRPTQPTYNCVFIRRHSEDAELEREEFKKNISGNIYRRKRDSPIRRRQFWKLQYSRWSCTKADKECIFYWREYMWRWQCREPECEHIGS